MASRCHVVLPLLVDIVSRSHAVLPGHVDLASRSHVVLLTKHHVVISTQCQDAMSSCWHSSTLWCLHFDVASSFDVILLKQRHAVAWSCWHSVTLSRSHVNILPWCPIVKLSPRYTVRLSCCHDHNVISSCWRIVMLWYAVTSLYCHFVIMFLRHVDVSSYCGILFSVMSLRHVDLSSYNGILSPTCTVRLSCCLIIALSHRHTVTSSH